MYAVNLLIGKVITSATIKPRDPASPVMSLEIIADDVIIHSEDHLTDGFLYQYKTDGVALDHWIGRTIKEVGLATAYTRPCYLHWSPSMGKMWTPQSVIRIEFEDGECSYLYLETTDSFTSLSRVSGMMFIIDAVQAEYRARCHPRAAPQWEAYSPLELSPDFIAVGDAAYIAFCERGMKEIAMDFFKKNEQPYRYPHVCGKLPTVYPSFIIPRFVDKGVEFSIMSTSWLDIFLSNNYLSEA